jgi:hypothetical protein
VILLPDTSDDDALRERLARLERDPRDAANIRYRAGTLLRDLASYTVNVTVAPEAGIELLDAYDVRHVLGTFMETSEACHAELLQNPKTGPPPDGGSACNGPSSVLVHLAWLLGERSAATRMIEIALDPVVVARLPKTRFWDAYFAALQGVARRTAFTLPQLELRGPETYWFRCMELARALARGADPAPYFAAVNAAFEKQNRDRRSTDWLSVDGDGNKPVKWNFRASSLRLAASRSPGSCNAE